HRVRRVAREPPASRFCRRVVITAEHFSGKQTVIKDESTDSLALTGLRVLEIGSGAALAYAGKLFADFGAEVIKVEDMAGDALRAVPPLLTGSASQTQSALNAWLNTNKRNVTLCGGR